MKRGRPLHHALDGALRPLERRLVAARALRGAAIGLGLGAAGVALGAPVAVGLALGGSVAGVGGLWPAPARSAVRRLDAAAGLDGALLCAWDHRDDDGPMHRAQRRRALAALAGRGDRPAVRAAPMPGWLWIAGPALWLLPLLAPVDGGPGVDPGEQAAPDPGAEAVGAAAGVDAPEAPASPAEAEARARAAEGAAEDAGVVGDGGAGDGGAADGGGSGDSGAGGAVKRIPGGAVGKAAGAQGGGGAGARSTPLVPGEGAPLILPAAAGDRDPGDGPAGRLVVGRTPPPPDAIADPARPYPSRYRPAIAAWFDRSRP